MDFTTKPLMRRSLLKHRLHKRLYNLNVNEQYRVSGMSVIYPSIPSVRLALQLFPDDIDLPACPMHLLVGR